MKFAHLKGALERNLGTLPIRTCLVPLWPTRDLGEKCILCVLEIPMGGKHLRQLFTYAHMSHQFRHQVNSNATFF